jgi:uncharacterized Zn finger protein
MIKCPKCGCDWEKWHHITSEGFNDHHCINCGCYLCYPPEGVQPKLKDLQDAVSKAKQEMEASAASYHSFIKRMEKRIAVHIQSTEEQKEL